MSPCLASMPCPSEAACPHLRLQSGVDVVDWEGEGG